MITPEFHVFICTPPSFFDIMKVQRMVIIMKDADTFFEEFRKRDVPPILRGLFVTACGREELYRVRYMERPTVIEKLIDLDKLQGIEVERTALDIRGNYEYSIVISPVAFMSNIDRYSRGI